MTTQLRYFSTDVAFPGDPCDVLTELARTSSSDTHFIYENGPVWTFAAGRAAELVVTASHTTLRGPAGTLVVDRDRRRLAEIPRLLDQLGGSDWQAHGIATFDLCYDNGTGAIPGNPVLLHLVLPEVEARLEGGRAVLRGTTRRAVTELAERIRQPVRRTPYDAVPVDVETTGGASYRHSVRSAIRQIRAGLLEKVILSRSVPVPADVDLYGSFALGRANNTPARSFLLNLDGYRAAGFSPETVLEVDPDGVVRTQPLAGTRALVNGDAELNARLRAELLSNAKEVYEHAVSVRAAWHDIAAVCRPDSISVIDFMSVKHRGTVQHLGSRVVGRLASGRGPWDALAAVFPAVTATGIPKPAAAEFIQRHERAPRGLYGGAVLQVRSDGGLDAALVLRTVFQRDGRTWLRAGAGIVAESDADREFEETCEKLRSVAQNLVARTESRSSSDAMGRSSGMSTDNAAGPSQLTRQRILADIAALIDRAPDEIDEQQSLIEQGLDSVALMTLVSKWRYLGVAADLVELAGQPTISAWWELFSRPVPANTTP
jgi:mycobactin phenyloxazoline synthetase